MANGVVMERGTSDMVNEVSSANARASQNELPMDAYIATQEIRRGQIGENDPVTVSENAWRTGGSRMFIKVGSQVTVSDLLHGIIIQSGNDASVALAEHIAGSEDAFADMMNKTVADLGMTNSHFMNPTGLPNPEHYSSAHDMAILARAIIRVDPTHYAIYSQKEFFWNGISSLTATCCCGVTRPLTV